MEIVDLGITEYTHALGIQEEYFNCRLTDSCGDTVLITEHYPVYTAGKTTKTEHIKSIPDSIPLIHIPRGGSITFHGKGQLVVYPILKIKSVKKFIWQIEEVMIQTLKGLGIDGYRLEKHRGVFTPKGKVGFVGVKVSKNTTYHGFSLNVNVDKSYFNRIVPCGLEGIPVANISDFVENIDTKQVKKIIIKEIKKVW